MDQLDSEDELSMIIMPPVGSSRAFARCARL